jgi:hypothetical protein
MTVSTCAVGPPNLVLILERWSSLYPLVGVSYQPHGGVLHCSIAGRINVLGSRLFILPEDDARFGFFEIDLTAVVECRSTVLGELAKLVAALNGGCMDILHREVLALSLGAAGHIFLFDLSK